MVRQYYSGGLPQGASIVTQLNEEDYTYTIGPSKTLCFPWYLRPRWHQLVITLANNTPYINVWIPGMRCWPSAEAAGTSITASPRQTQASVNMNPNGVDWNFHIFDIQQDQLKPANIYHVIKNDVTYWMNIQNLQNSTNYFYCKFHYYGNGIERIT